MGTGMGMGAGTGMVTRAPTREHLVIRVAHCTLALLTWTGGHASPLCAQLSIDASGLSVRYDGVDALQGARLGPSVRLAGERLYLEARGNGVQFSDATWSLDGGAVLGWRPFGQRALTPEDRKQFEQLYYRAVEQYLRGDLDAADQYAKEVSRLDPSSDAARQLRDKIDAARRYSR